MNRVTVAVLGLFIVILLGSGLLAYVLREEPKTAAVPAASPSVTPAGENQSQREIPLIGQLFGPDPTGSRPRIFRPGKRRRHGSLCGFRSLRFSRHCSRFVRDAVSQWRGVIHT